VLRRTSAALLTALALGAALRAGQTAYPIFPVEEFVRMMKSVGANWGGTTASIGKGDFAETKRRLTRSREQLAVTITFWRDHKKDDAVTMLRAALAKMDELDAVLSADTVDAGAAAARAEQVTGACEKCHAVYRDQHPVTKAYRVKPGALR
jgi:cytochrome c556